MFPMLAPEILERIRRGEDSFTQFKRDVVDANRLAEEIVAFANACGGLLLIGVDDDGTVPGLDASQISRINQLISNTASENVKPPVYPMTEIVELGGSRVLVVNIRRGDARPYQTSKGVYFTKSGSDKRKMSPDELRRLFAETARLFADEEVLSNSQLGDINHEAVYAFLERDNPLIADELRHGTLQLTTVLENLELSRQGHLTLAGNLIFGKLPQKYTPSFYVDCVYFDGNDVAVTGFVDKSTIRGSLLLQYEGSMSFIRHNLRRVPLGDGFNAQTTLEVDERVFAELMVNALVHRDYYIQSSIKVFIFHDRLEIISPGKLTNSLTVDKIKAGLAIHRNPILNSICKGILPYSGYGSGIKRALHLKPDLELVEDRDKEEFRCVIPRRS